MRHTAVPAHVIGGVRRLSSAEMPLLKDHLLRLDPSSRHARFNGIADDDFIARYADRCLADGTVVIGYVENGRVHAAAELHPFNDDDAPEVAFSVEAPYRRQGLGSVLFTRLIAEARRRGMSALRITTGSDNHAMRALARKFGAELTFRQGETTGLIALEHEGAEAAPRVPSAWIVPLDLARASVRLNHAYWASVLQSYAAGLPAAGGRGARPS